MPGCQNSPARLCITCLTLLSPGPARRGTKLPPTHCRSHSESSVVSAISAFIPWQVLPAGFELHPIMSGETQFCSSGSSEPTCERLVGQNFPCARECAALRAVVPHKRHFRPTHQPALSSEGNAKGFVKELFSPRAERRDGRAAQTGQIVLPCRETGIHGAHPGTCSCCELWG